jgi:hypothetical protein
MLCPYSNKKPCKWDFKAIKFVLIKYGRQGVQNYKLYDCPFHRAIFGRNVNFDEDFLLKVLNLMNLIP